VSLHQSSQIPYPDYTTDFPHLQGFWSGKPGNMGMAVTIHGLKRGFHKK
jgi:hypothetical protein